MGLSGGQIFFLEAVKALGKRVRFGFLGGHELPLAHGRLCFLGPLFGLGLGVEGLASGGIAALPDPGLPLEISTLSDGRHAPPLWSRVEQNWSIKASGRPSFTS